MTALAYPLFVEGARIFRSVGK